MNSPVYQSLAARIEKLRQKAITSVEEPIAFLEQALLVAQDVVAADRTAEEGRLEELEPLVDLAIQREITDVMTRLDGHEHALRRQLELAGDIRRDALNGLLSSRTS